MGPARPLGRLPLRPARPKGAGYPTWPPSHAKSSGLYRLVSTPQFSRVIASVGLRPPTCSAKARPNTSSKHAVAGHIHKPWMNFTIDYTKTRTGRPHSRGKVRKSGNVQPALGRPGWCPKAKPKKEGETGIPTGTAQDRLHN